MFITKQEKNLADQYLKNGYVVTNITDLKTLNWLSKFIVKQSISVLNIKIDDIKDDQEFLDNIKKYLKPKNLNEFKLKILHKVNSNISFRKKFFEISKNLVESIVGNELLMQLRIGMSVQLPHDKSALLPVHADTWSGVSPFESVIWLPLVDCQKTKSMFILPNYKSTKYKNLVLSKKVKKSDDIFKKIKKDLIWLNVKYGQIVIFDQSLPHGNVENKEKTSRWSFNCRFKSVFTPFADKRLGEYYEPITLKAATIRGLKYKI